ncbi:MAG: divergent PAP2 family protein [Candidatus Nanoarchaeia archaeon]
MNGFLEFITGYFLIAVLCAWLSSVILKFVFRLMRKEKNSISLAFSNGGMPSSHSALVASLSAAIYLVEGLTTVFYLSVLIALVIMSDAIRVRKNLGEQGDTLNRLLVKLKQNPISVVHGHSLFQVLVGALWGIFVSLLVFQIMF